MARDGNSRAEAAFLELFCELYGPEKRQYIYTQYPFQDIYNARRAIDYAFCCAQGKVAIEIDGETWHNPGKISAQKYEDDLLRQNSLVHQGWKVFRWTDTQVRSCPDRVRDELVTFFGQAPHLFDLDSHMPQQTGETFSLLAHQREALARLAALRQSGKAIALLYEATGTGKTVTAVSDAKAFGQRVLFLAHTKELVQQAQSQFRRLWPEVTVGQFAAEQRDTDCFVLCATVQSISRHLSLFEPEEFGYLIVDEAHHAVGQTYQSVLQYFRPRFTLGLTATPERMDGEDLLSTFRECAHRLDLPTAVEQGLLVPVRCIRIRTNIDLREVRVGGFSYNALDLETRLLVPERNQLIVDTYLHYVKDQPTLVFCTSVRHAESLTTRFQQAGVRANCVSGQTPTLQRQRILQQYESGDIQVLLACDLLTEGWDSPRTAVLFMARPTLSRTLYLQQLGRGMRLHPDKAFLMVFDFVDNAALFHTPYSLHRLVGEKTYYPGALVLAPAAAKHWDAITFAHGEKPQALIDYPVHALDMEIVDLFDWQEQAKHMVSQMELVRSLSVQSETIDKYIRQGKIQPDLEVPLGNGRSFRYFKKQRIAEYAETFSWQVITRNNRKEVFLQYVHTMTMSYSYKPVFLLAFFAVMTEDGEAHLVDVSTHFAAFYDRRRAEGLPPERHDCLFTRDTHTEKEVIQLILRNPFRRFEQMGFMSHSKVMGIIRLERTIVHRLTPDDRDTITQDCHAAIQRYFQDP